MEAADAGQGALEVARVAVLQVRYLAAEALMKVEVQVISMPYVDPNVILNIDSILLYCTVLNCQ